VRVVAQPLTRIVEAKFLATAPAPQHFPQPVGMEIAFAGRSNVGKSSLLNVLLGHSRLARTSSTPGCTRQIGFYEVRTGDGALLRLVDLPGYGYARRAKSERVSWGGLMESYLLERPTLAAVVVLVDVRRGIEADDQDLIDLIGAPPRVARSPVAVVLVATKLDKLPRSAHKPALQKIGSQTKQRVIGFSTEHRDAGPLLWGSIRQRLGLAV
jgi:GTP-binding protein